mmetsp:Transcript_60077/g.130296  ORF Transcript_60077/g.130296 Transcript_60077/m.130296 type:complete len:309 (-) Transcript_60077:52-978(-)
MAAPEEQEIQRVEVDALVILQITKHCAQQAPHPVTGALLGLDVNETLQVTHSFGNVEKGSEEHDRAPDNGEEYQLNMLRKLREVNVDSNNIGWYQTTHLGQFFSDSVIENQYLYQRDIPQSVLLVYDPLQARIGKPAFKALRLSAPFVAKYSEAREMNKSALNDFPSSKMFVEIPISVHSPVIVEAFLVDWAIMDPVSTTQIEALDVENQAFLEKNVQLLISSLTELAEEQLKMTAWERQAGRQQDPAKGKGRGYRPVTAQPRQLDTMILSQQIHNYCRQINNSAGDSFGKVFLLSNKPGGLRAQAAE